MALIASVAVASPVRAENESAEVEALIQRGIELRRAGDDESALQVFARAEKLAPDSVRVLLHVATAAQASGQWLTAHQYLSKAGKEHAEDPYYLRHRSAIAQVERAVRQRVGRLRVVGEPEGAQVSLNGAVIGTLPMTDSVNVETGTYVLDVSMQGYYPLRRSLAIGGGGLTREIVSLNEPPPGSKLPAVVGPRGQGARVDPGLRNWWQSPWVTWTLGGIGVAAAATSGAALLVREQRVDTWNDETRCLDPVNPDELRVVECGGVRDSIEAAETVAAIGAVAAGTFGAAALIHWWLTAEAERPTAQTARSGGLSATCAAGFLSLTCEGSF